MQACQGWSDLIQICLYVFFTNHVYIAAKTRKNIGIWNKVLLLYLNYYFYINKRDKIVLKRVAKTVTHSVQSGNTSFLPSWKKQLSNTEEQEKPHPQQEPTQSMKPTKVEGPSFMNNFISLQRKKTKELVSLWMDNASSSNAILFLAFQIVQKLHMGLALQTLFFFFFSHK